ncbi:capping protein-inhibiting regulator of actin dynamics isoform X2 [Ambystoma mexicanum]|uniref:capping protein-inhibiting regulator of actin dynamics isoform X2 n=1 Tax=Ambystoma mexicanum TaxID=8296 RepID=UPI0037E9410D
MGTRAFSHDSIFIPDGQAEDELAAQAMSQDNILGKVKTLQQQLVKNIKFGQPPTTVAGRRMHDTEEDKMDGGSPTDQMEVLSHLDAALSDNDNKDTPVKPSRSKRPITGSSTIHSINLDAVPRAVARLDNSAAKHKLSVKPKNQRQSKKHKLAKHQETLQKGQKESTEQSQYKEQHSNKNEHPTPEKHIIHVEIHTQSGLSEFKRQHADHQRYLEEEQERQHEEEKQREEARVQFIEEEKRLRLEEQLNKDERKRQEELKFQELEAHRRHEKQRQREQEEQRRHEMAAQQFLEEERKAEEEQKQKQLEELRRLEEQEQHELEEQKHRELMKQRMEEEKKRQEERKQKELEEQRRVEEEKQRELEEQKYHLAEQHRLEEERKRQEALKQREVEERRKREEQQQRELEEQKQRDLAELQRLAEERKRQDDKRHRELEERRQQEEQRQRELEEQKRRELAEQQRLEEERKRQDDQRQKELEERRQQEEQRQRELEEQKQRELAEQQRLEEERKRQDDQRQKELEKRRKQEEQRQRELEEQKRRELAEKQRLEEERKRQDDQRQNELKKRRQQEEQRHRELEERKFRELEEQRLEEERKRKDDQILKQLEESRRLEEQRQLEVELAERQHQAEEQKRQEEQKQKELEEKRQQEEQRQHELMRQKRLEAEEHALKRRQEGQRTTQMEKQTHQELEQHTFVKKEALLSGSFERPSLDKESSVIHEETQHKLKQPALDVLEQATENQKRQANVREQERIGEELKWQEMDQRQAMPRPYTFQVSSGEKQIIFQKVNLSPVTPSKESVHLSDVKEPKNKAQSKGSHSLPSLMSVPHTAILVTGAQLCGTAVNLNQIKDTACKSLLGLTEERKALDYPGPEHTPKVRDHDSKPSKTKFTSESLDNQAMLAEWASIRSRILKGAENGKVKEKDEKTLSRCSDDWTGKGKGDFHGNLRKTLSASAKFSITPAWQKFPETAKANADDEHTSPVKQAEDKKVEGKTLECDSSNKEEAQSSFPTCVESLLQKGTSMTEKNCQKSDNALEGCKFAKDLPSFLVPSPPQSPNKGLSQPDSPTTSEGQLCSSMKRPEKAGQSGEEKTSPFGIKLRRTNYSLRFHYDQQGEQKRKKRYSAGDSFDGVPIPLIKTDCEKEPRTVSLKQFTSPQKEYRDASNSITQVSSSDTSSETGLPLLPPINSHISPLVSEKQVPKSFPPQKPALSPKPISPTPPSSPLARTNQLQISETLGHSVPKTEADDTGQEEEQNMATALSPLQTHKNDDEEAKEKKSFFPSINIPWREKAEKKPELSRKDKPVLQSRHSIDGSRLPEKVETAQPLWITLALQKQKGFREQQATREERKQAREAKQAEKLAKENVGVSNQSDSRASNVSRVSPQQKPTTHEDEKKLETPLTRVERREQFKKSNTLPTSVTVEIADSVSSAPLVKDISKRFSTPDATQLSTEPAWLALAKRKAKAWSDCPQIIK